MKRLLVLFCVSTLLVGCSRAPDPAAVGASSSETAINQESSSGSSVSSRRSDVFYMHFSNGTLPIEYKGALRYSIPAGWRAKLDAAQNLGMYPGDGDDPYMSLIFHSTAKNNFTDEFLVERVNDLMNRFAGSNIGNYGDCVILSSGAHAGYSCVDVDGVIHTVICLKVGGYEVSYYYKSTHTFDDFLDDADQILSSFEEISSGFSTASEAAPEDEPYKPTVGEQNALKSAKDYLKISAFSYDGLVEQLEYEGFEHDEAVYAADNCGADWNEQAYKSAKEYLEFDSFSRSGLIEQLEYEGFTKEQAEYGVSQAYDE